MSRIEHRILLCILVFGWVNLVVMASSNYWQLKNGGNDLVFALNKGTLIVATFAVISRYIILGRYFKSIPIKEGLFYFRPYVLSVVVMFLGIILSVLVNYIAWS